MARFSSLVLICAALIMSSGLVWGKENEKSAPGEAVAAQKMQTGAWRGSQLLGINAHGADGRRVGSIADIVGDVKGQVVYVILSVGGVAGIGNKLVPLPWEVVGPGGKPSTLSLQLNKQDLEQAPSFNPDNWPDFNQSEWKEKTQKYYQALGTKKKEKSK